MLYVYIMAVACSIEAGTTKEGGLVKRYLINQERDGNVLNKGSRRKMAAQDIVENVEEHYSFCHYFCIALTQSLFSQEL